MFSIENFIEDCVSTVEHDPTHKGVADLFSQSLGQPRTASSANLGEPTEMTNQVLYKSDKLTIMNVVWAPGMTVMPHNHDMWAIIGMYGGREDNIYWRRIKDHPNGKIEAAGALLAGHGRIHAPWQGHHPLGDQSAGQTFRRHPHLWRRFLRSASERVGFGDTCTSMSGTCRRSTPCSKRTEVQHTDC